MGSKRKKISYQLIMTICKIGSGYVTTLMEDGNWIKVDENGTRSIIKDTLEAIGMIYSCAVVLLYETKELKVSENYNSKLEIDFMSVQSHILLTESSDEEEGNQSSNSLLSDDEHEREFSGQQRKSKKSATRIPIILRNGKRELDKYDALFEKLKTKDKDVSRNMTEDEFERLAGSRFLKSGLKFLFKGDTFTARSKLDGRTNGIQLIKDNFGTTSYLCRVCLRPSLSQSYIYFCQDHADGNVGISVVLVSSTTKEGHSLSVLKMHSVFEEKEKVLKLLKTEAIRVLGKSIGSRSDFKLDFEIDEGTLMKFKIFKKARSYLLALQIWSWLNFKILLNSKAQYFSTKAVGLGSEKPLSECNHDQAKRHLCQIARNHKFCLEIKTASNQPMTKNEQRIHRFRSFLDRGLHFNRPMKDRSTIYSVYYGGHGMLYYGLSGHSDSVVASYHSSSQAENKNKTLYKLDTSESPSKRGEGCFSTNDKDVACVLESSIQLAGFIGQIFQLRHVSHKTTPQMINCGVVAVNNVMDMNKDKYPQVLEKMLQLEYQHRLELTRDVIVEKKDD